jgi:lanthanide-dependent methanol dehydrogenase
VQVDHRGGVGVFIRDEQAFAIGADIKRLGVRPGSDSVDDLQARRVHDGNAVFVPESNIHALAVVAEADTTWPLAHGHSGGCTWGWYSYDPELNLLYYATGNPGTWNPSQRQGDNKWSMASFARDPDTGMAKWSYQMTPWDAWDYDEVNENVLADLSIDGRPVKALVHFDRNGFGYTLDRTNGTLLVAEPYVYINWATEGDKKTGRPIEDPAKRTKQGVDVKDICPCAMGGKDQQPSAFSPRTGLFYVPTNNMCMNYEGLVVKYTAGAPYVGANVLMFPGRDGHMGEFLAWDATKGRKVWGIKEPQPAWSGALATAGDVVFYGTLDGWFKAVHAKTGDLLWKSKQGGLWHYRCPDDFHAPDRRQVVRGSVSRGWGLVLPAGGGWAAAR